MNDWFSALYVCSDCGHKGFPCPCVSTCEKCGFIFNNRYQKHCTHRVHKYDAEVENAFINGYWCIDPVSCRLYKTWSWDIRHIYQELDKGNVFFSRKEFNELVRKGLERQTASGPTT